MTSVLNRLQRRGVKIASKISFPVVGYPVETARDACDETVPVEYRQSVTGVALNRTAEVLDCRRCQVPLILQQLKDAIITGHHPLSRLSHSVVRVSSHTHRDIDYL